MSKSLGEKHYIGVFEPEASVRKKIRSHVTDVGATERTGGRDIPPGVGNLLGLLQASAPADLVAQFEEADPATWSPAASRWKRGSSACSRSRSPRKTARRSATY